MPPARRVLFTSPHCYFDPSSGAALATRDLFDALSDRGWECGVFCGSRQDFQSPLPFDWLLKQYGLTADIRSGELAGASTTLYHFRQKRVRVSTFHPTTPWSQCVPQRGPGEAYLNLLQGVLDRFDPDVVMAYGGDPLSVAVLQMIRARRIPLVFALHNDSYHGPQPFEYVDSVLVPSKFARELYKHRLRMNCVAISGLFDWSGVECDSVTPHFLTIVNPQPSKGVTWQGRIIYELARLRPDIPILAVEGRGRIDWLGRCGVDLTGVDTVTAMRHAPDARDFYRIAKVLLMPSLWQETFGRVAAEAMLNGIPVLASDRGALPDTVGQGGFIFSIPATYTKESLAAPSAAEVRPWLDVIERLWDDPGFYEQHRQLAREQSEQYRVERLAPQYEAYLESVIAGTAPRPFP